MNSITLRQGLQEGRRGGVWDYVSPSRLSRWLACPLAFSLQYLDRLERAPTASLFLGKMVHAGLELYYRQRQAGVRLTAQEVGWSLTETWGERVAEEGISFATLEAEEACKRQAIDLVAAYLAQVPADEPAPLAVEETFEAPLIDPQTGEDLGLPLVGIVDLVLDAPEGPVLIDFKTAARGGAPPEIVHELQLTAYAYLFRTVHGRVESGCEIRSLVKTRQPAIERHRYPARGDRHFGRLFAVLRGYLADLEARRFHFRPHLLCGGCDYRSGPCAEWAG